MIHYFSYNFKKTTEKKDLNHNHYLTNASPIIIIIVIIIITVSITKCLI